MSLFHFVVLSGPLASRISPISPSARRSRAHWGRTVRAKWNRAAMSAWDSSATSQPGSTAGAPTVVNASLQAGASFHLHQPGGASTSWAVEQ
eukprot:14668781-Alexandrium_andersonii.AAC.1